MSFPFALMVPLRTADVLVMEDAEYVMTLEPPAPVKPKRAGPAQADWFPALSTALT